MAGASAVRPPQGSLPSIPSLLHCCCSHALLPAAVLLVVFNVPADQARTLLLKAVLAHEAVRQAVPGVAGMVARLLAYGRSPGGALCYAVYEGHTRSLLDLVKHRYAG